jgi:hypothetical protein
LSVKSSQSYGLLQKAGDFGNIYSMNKCAIGFLSGYLASPEQSEAMI